MEIRDYLSDDGQALLTLCSAFGLVGNAAADGPTPLKLSEWNQLERQLAKSSLKTPSSLQGRSASELETRLSIAADEAERLVRLLDRAGHLAFELEQLFSRGMWAVTRLDEHYPAKLRSTLKHQAPVVLFGAGEMRLLKRGGIAVVGSRNIDDAGAAFAKEIGRKTANARLPVISGGARGTDRIAMDGSLEADGDAIGALADSLVSTVNKSDVRELLLDGRLALLTPYAPAAGFSVGAAMGRNKLIYGLADFAVVVSSDYQSGGTWAGAVEALKADWCPVFARDGQGVPKGNRELLKLAASPLPETEISAIEDLPEWLREHATVTEVDRDLFS